MENLFDIHTHILPYVDDGAKSIEESIDMIKHAVAHGTRGIVLTPHYRGKFRENSIEDKEKALNSLTQELKTLNIKVDLYLGCEIHYEEDAPNLLFEHKILSMNNTKYCLLEFSNYSELSKIIHGTAETIRFGFIPIIAHVERYHNVVKNKNIVYELIENGALLQINAESLLGEQGFLIKNFCKYLMKNNLVSFIASDAHNLTNRKPELDVCYNYILKRYGIDVANKIFILNPQKMLRNEIL